MPLVEPRSLNRIELAPNQSVLSKSTLPNFVKNEAYVFVVDSEGAIQIAPRLSTGKSGVKHTQLTGGAPAKGAGEMMLSDDGILYINNQSGRYRAQDINAVNQVKTQLEEWNAQVKIVEEEIK